MPLISCKVQFWIGNCVLATSVNIANDAIANVVKATFKIKDAKIYVPAVTLSTKDNVNLAKNLSRIYETN